MSIAPDDLWAFVNEVVDETPILDIHTHLYSPRFGPLLLYGIDELLTYHYLIAEVIRAEPIPYHLFWKMAKTDQADHIWKTLFVDRSPVSEACRGVLTVLQAFGLDPKQRDLTGIREHLARMDVDAYVDKVLELAGVRSVIMTNDPFDEQEKAVWKTGLESDSRFQPALRIDPLFNDWSGSVGRLRDQGYELRGDLGPADVDAIKRFLIRWIDRIRPRYLAVSLPPDFIFPDESLRSLLLNQCILPVARDANLPFAMMIGVRRQLNPHLRLAGDGVGQANVHVVSHLCERFPENRFLVTMLSRENQHELCVTARKHPNLMIFGCWWFLNNPSIVEEITRERFELLGLSFVPQHSDARVLDQIIYKWSHSRRIIADVLADKYADLAAAGWTPTQEEIRRDVTGLLGGTFEQFCSTKR